MNKFERDNEIQQIEAAKRNCIGQDGKVKQEKIQEWAALTMLEQVQGINHQLTDIRNELKSLRGSANAQHA